jgi:hypothetical protein
VKLGCANIFSHKLQNASDNVGRPLRSDFHVGLVHTFLHFRTSFTINSGLNSALVYFECLTLYNRDDRGCDEKYFCFQ